jgi:transcription factor CP2 and related proteins
MNFPNLPILKQEIPSPPNGDGNGANKTMRNLQQFPKLTSSCMRIQPQQAAMVTESSDQQQQQQSGSGNSSSSNGLSNFLEQLNSGDNSHANTSGNRMMSEDYRFQYVLAAATSIATKSNEETLTYLNQGQSYEIKLKKLGDLSNCRGKMIRSIIKICFHERRLQYMEREQLQIWQSSRPGEKILDIDIPLSYGLLHVNQSVAINTAEILWDPMKEVGVYIKVNCISTEFTPKKHGGEKGVPFRIQIETYIDGINEAQQNQKPVHAAACQIKVRIL